MIHLHLGYLMNHFLRLVGFGKQMPEVIQHTHTAWLSVRPSACPCTAWHQLSEPHQKVARVEE